MKNKILKKKIDIYKKDGYVVFRNFISKKKIKNLTNDLENLFKLEINTDNEKINNQGINDIKFNKKIIEFRKNEPEKFSKVYNVIKGSPSLISLLNDRKIISLVSKVLNIKKSFLWNGEYQLRMDTPFDNRNSLGWHQDANYYLDKTKSGKNGVVISIAISKKIKKKNGALILCPKSHNSQLIPPKDKVDESENISKKFKSITRGIDKKLINKYAQKTIEMQCGDLILMDLRTFHRSGLNSSNLIRFSTINRLFDTTTREWKT